MALLTSVEAAALAGVSERTVRKWVLSGKLTRHEGEDGRPRYDREEVSRVRNGSEPGSEPEPGDSEAREESAEPVPNETEGALRARIHGLEIALRIHASRRGQLESEVAWLRARLVEAERASSELRVLVQNAQRETLAISERLALPPVRPWWRFW